MKTGNTVDASGLPGQFPPTATFRIKKNGIVERIRLAVHHVGVDVEEHFIVQDEIDVVFGPIDGEHVELLVEILR